MFGIGYPSSKELQCLANLRQWDAGLEFAAQWGDLERQVPKRNSRKAARTPKYDLKTMSPAVARSLGLI